MAVFIVCEFDPFHYGHEYIIKEAKRLCPGEPVVCVMSGNFVQRGRPACADGYLRAECAVKGGADLVLSLPFPWSMASAEHFAYGALSVISGLYKDGDALVFGSECADIKRLTEAAMTVSSKEFQIKLKEYIKATKKPYAKAREELYGDGKLFSSPNDILGVEYVKASFALCPGLSLYAVRRRESFRSSTNIKNSENPLELIPGYAKEILSCAEFPADIKYAERIILSHLRTDPYKYAADGENGLIGRISKAAGKADCFDALITAASSPQFTNARIRRAALYSYFGINTAKLRQKPAFTQLFAADSAGLSYLSKIRKNKRIDIITKPADRSKLSAAAREQFDTQSLSDAFYCFCTKTVRDGAYFIKASPYISTRFDLPDGP